MQVLIALACHYWARCAAWWLTAAWPAIIRTWRRTDDYLKITTIVALIVSFIAGILFAFPDDSKPNPPGIPVGGSGEDGTTQPEAVNPAAPPTLPIRSEQVLKSMVAAKGWGPEQYSYLYYYWSRNGFGVEHSSTDFQKALDSLQKQYGTPENAYLVMLQGEVNKLKTPARTSYEIRDQMVSDGYWAANHNSQFGYSEIRPIPLVPRRSNQYLWTDCSGLVTILAYWGGASDPNGLGYSGYGYTGTLLVNMPHISQRQAKAGDIVVLGGANGNHAVMLLQNGTVSDPLVVSLGQPGDPGVYRLSQQISYSGAPTFLRVIKTTPTDWTVSKNGETLTSISKKTGVPVSTIIRLTLAKQGSFSEWQSGNIQDGYIDDLEQPGLHWTYVDFGQKLPTIDHGKVYTVEGTTSLRKVASDNGVPISTVLRLTLEKYGKFDHNLSIYMQDGNLTKPLPQGIKLVVGD